jgi:hypothetical protein
VSKYRRYLPQLDGGLFLTDGGIETTLIFHEGLELPYFAAFDLLKDRRGAMPSAATSSATSRSPSRRSSDLSSKARLGAQASIGARSSDTQKRLSRPSTRTPSS